MTTTVPISVIINPNKTNELFEIDSNERGFKSITFTSESEVILFSCNITSLAKSGKVYWEVFTVPGDSNDHEVRLFQSPTSGGIGVKQESIAVSGRVKLTLFYTSAVTLEMSATGISGVFANKIQTVIIKQTESQKQFEDCTVQQLINIEDILTRILNHQRNITDIEKDKGEKF